MPVSFLHTKQTAHDFTDPPLEEFLLVISLGSDMPFRWHVGDGWSEERRMRTGDMNLCPPSAEIMYDCRGDHELLVIGMPNGIVTSLFEYDATCGQDSFAILHDSAVFRDETVRSTALRMWAEASQDDRASRLMIDGLLQTLTAQLLRLSDLPTAVCPTSLAPEVLARLDDYIIAHLEENIALSDLSALSNYSQSHFARCFKETTGKSPHQYVLDKKVERARELLRDRELALVEIAYACGFSSQSHMTDVFRTKLGITPGRYRTDLS